LGLARAGARLPESSGEPTQELAFRLRHARLEVWAEPLEPPAALARGALSSQLHDEL
jgi:hypothetical protein